MEQGLLMGVALVTLAGVTLICVSVLAKVTMRVVDTMTALADKDAAAQVFEARPQRAPKHAPVVEMPPDMAAHAAGWSPEYARDLHDIAGEPPVPLRNGVGGGV